MFACNIPFEIQEQIIKHLPVKSLIRFRSVSKQWKSLIDSSQFITDHTSINNRNQPLHLLINCSYSSDPEHNYLSIVNDGSFPRHNSYLTVSPIIKLVCSPILLDCSHGLVCLYSYNVNRLNDDKNKLIVLWNPSIRKSVGVMLPSYESTAVGFAIGFGICTKTNDVKIVNIVDPDGLTGSTAVDLKADVFALSTGTWRTVSVNLHMPFSSVEFDSKQVVVDGRIYWLAYVPISYHALIVSFDLTSEEFEQVEVPEKLARSINKSIAKFKDSLALICYEEDLMGCDVWTMTMIKNGDPKSSFTKLFAIDFVALETSSFCNVIGFRMNGDVIMEEDDTGRLKVYEPGSKRIIDLEIDVGGDNLGFQIAYYTESLLLLDHHASIIN